MICFSCGHCSQHVMCPYCGAGTTAGGRFHAVGFSLSDIPNPFGYAFDLGKTIAAPSSTNVQPSSNGPSLWDRISSNIPNPYTKAYDTGYAIGDKATGLIKGPLGAVSSFLTVLKYVLIGGVVVGAVVLLYGVIRFLPVALGVAAKQAEMGIKTMGQVATKAL